MLLLLVAIGTAGLTALSGGVPVSGGIQNLGRPVEVIHLSDADQILAMLARISCKSKLRGMLIAQSGLATAKGMNEIVRVQLLPMVAD